jgi:hypothetical protein
MGETALETQVNLLGGNSSTEELDKLRHILFRQNADPMLVSGC